MLIDDVLVKVKAGNGGRGAVAFNKNVRSLGPTGGSGGKGGSVYVEGVPDLNALNQFRYRKDIKAKNGEPGKDQCNDGAGREDLVLQVPVGTVVSNTESGEKQEVLKIGERILIAKGGIGGKGNFLFRSSTNTTPKQFQEGLPGEQLVLRLELKLIASIGIIGLPNAGKSSLLNELTKAQSKVASYAFTTLEPSLGAYYELILADIPGLIEGASLGKGLGTKFLRHIERTKILFHLISAESEDPARDYRTIRKELEAYNTELTQKPEYVFLSKSDTVSSQELQEKIAALKEIQIHALPISIHDWNSLEEVRKILNKIKTDILNE